uniref:palmitoyltransferase ZDHHC23 isoform X1 n=1 Tax=Myxine glutinosa TaxID=7769 RepID=UPI00358F93E7
MNTQKDRGRGGGRRTREAGESELCCCEYINLQGEMTHLLACCCDCEELDSTCDSLLRCKALKPGSLRIVAETVADRLRVPWFHGGARRIDISVTPPVLLLPPLLHFASIHPALTVLTLASTPPALLWYYYLTHRRKSRSLFFLALGLSSLGYLYGVFVTQLWARHAVGNGQLAAITAGVATTLGGLARTRRDPGYVSTMAKNEPRSFAVKTPFAGGRATAGTCGVDEKSNALPRNGVVSRDWRDDQGWSWCELCEVLRPPRSAHCRLCGRCVRRLDHHCVWIDSCIGESNHRWFLLTISFFLLTATYGLHVAFSCICPQSIFPLSMFYCPGVYQDASSALVFACAWYAILVTLAVLTLLAFQLHNVSHGVTEREARIRARRHSAKRRGSGERTPEEQWVQQGGPPVRMGAGGHQKGGVLLNWKHFLFDHDLHGSTSAEMV